MGKYDNNNLTIWRKQTWHSKTSLKDELEADSLDLFQIINDIEDEFDVKIDTEDGLETVEDLVKYVDNQLAEK